ncbi:hypothetical protein BDB00DRAFT_842993 [Zychaea mexicana]|uniref:uncharacterized protein n=1 Tax=Zychaea mexicana TaxID=64656 RepID=UPI0022FE111E|nr:uncharacterized protein BDB00DRAFT_842993 [Zychaea mexicana]KAI9489457.1 hypothetical protein BDB00DRAFT_842993 [Zychaea mexicana]
MNIQDYIPSNAKESQPLHYANGDDLIRSNNFESSRRITASSSTMLSSIPENEAATTTMAPAVPSITTTQGMSNANNMSSSIAVGDDFGQQPATQDLIDSDTQDSVQDTLDPALLLSRYSRYDKRKSSPAVLGLLPGLSQNQLAMHLSQQRNSIEAAMLLANLNKLSTEATTAAPTASNSSSSSSKPEQGNKGTPWQDDMSLETQQKSSWDDDLGTSLEAESMRRHSYDVGMTWNTMPESFLGRSDLMPNLGSSSSSTENEEMEVSASKLTWTQDGMVVTGNDTGSSTTGEYAHMFEFMQHPTSPRPPSSPPSLPPSSSQTPSFPKHSPFYYQQLPPPPYPPPHPSYPAYQQQLQHPHQQTQGVSQPPLPQHPQMTAHHDQSRPLPPPPQPMDPYYRPYNQHPMHPPPHPYYYHPHQQPPPHQGPPPLMHPAQIPGSMQAAPPPPPAAPRTTKRKKAKVDEDEGDVVEPGDPDFPDMAQRDVEAARNDPEARPRRQKMRFDDDQYTPRWVRYNGQAKEGLCDTCTPGKWLQLKNSAFWYHKQFFHGISSVSGRPFIQPVETRWVDQDLVEGLCHQCGQWVAVSNVKRKNSVLWYRHAHKCHVYHKPKTGTPKKR